MNYLWYLLHHVSLASLHRIEIPFYCKYLSLWEERPVILTPVHQWQDRISFTQPPPVCQKHTPAVSRDPEKTAPIHQAQTCISPWSNFELPGAQDLAEVGFLGEKNAQSRLLILPTFWLFNFQRVAVEVGGAEGRWGGRTSRSVYTQPLTRRLRLRSLLIQTFVWLQVSVVDTAVKYDALE